MAELSAKRGSAFGRLAPLGPAAIAFALGFVGIESAGYGNAYYAAAVRSMTQSFHNFFFAAFDPAGVVSVDKPPLGLWMQALSALIFGYRGWALMLPQALSCAGSAYLIYRLVERYFDRPAAALAGLAFALTPVVVAVSRNNTMDMQLVFVLLLATHFLFRAVETGRWKPLILASALVGLGFNVKMLQAYLILPAAGLTYLLFSRQRALRTILASAASLVLIAAVSLAWTVAVDMTPAGSRPYVGSSTDNTVLELIVGHNGMERLYGRNRGGNSQSLRESGDAQRGGRSETEAVQRQRTADVPAPSRSAGEGGGTSGPGNAARSAGTNSPGNARQGSGAGSDEIGAAGWLRLFGDSLLGQIAWLLPFAFLGLLSFPARLQWRERSMRQGALVYWALWLVTCTLFFSFAGFFHRYYLCMIAPPLAALTGMGLSNMVRALRERDGRRALLLPVALAASAALACHGLRGYPAIARWLSPSILALTGLAIALAVAAWFASLRGLRATAALAAAAAILAAPAWWSFLTATNASPNVRLPYAGPSQGGGNGNLGSADDKLEAYLVSQYVEGTYLVVARSSSAVSDLIISTGLPAVAYGGFVGSDEGLTLEEFQRLVEEGKIRFFLLSGQGGGSGEIESYVLENAQAIPAAEYGGSGRTELYRFP